MWRIIACLNSWTILQLVKLLMGMGLGVEIAAREQVPSGPWAVILTNIPGFWHVLPDTETWPPSSMSLVASWKDCWAWRCAKVESARLRRAPWWGRSSRTRSGPLGTTYAISNRSKGRIYRKIRRPGVIWDSSTGWAIWKTSPTSCSGTLRATRLLSTWICRQWFHMRHPWMFWHRRSTRWPCLTGLLLARRLKLFLNLFFVLETGSRDCIHCHLTGCFGLLSWRLGIQTSW